MFKVLMCFYVLIWFSDVWNKHLPVSEILSVILSHSEKSCLINLKLTTLNPLSYISSQGYGRTMWSKSHVCTVLSWYRVFFIIFTPPLMAFGGSRYELCCCDSTHDRTDCQIQAQQQLLDWQFSYLSAAVTISCNVGDCNLLISFFIGSAFI